MNIRSVLHAVGRLLVRREQLIDAVTPLTARTLPFAGDPAKYREYLTHFVKHVHTACTLNANAIAETPLRVYTRRGTIQGRCVRADGRKRLADNAGFFARKSVDAIAEDVVEVTDLEHPVVRRLITPGAVCSGAEMLRLLSIWLQMTGNAYLAMVGDGLPEELIPCNPADVHIRLDENGSISSYEVGSIGRRLPLSPQSVVHVRTADPTRQSAYGRGDYAACEVDARLSEELSVLAHEMVVRGFYPGLSVTPDMPLTKDQQEQYTKQLAAIYSGVRNAGRAIVWPKGTTVSHMEPPKSAVEFFAGGPGNRTEQTIANAFGVPVAFIRMETSSLAEMREAMPNWQRLGVLPRARIIEDALNAQLLPRYRAHLKDPYMFVAFDHPVEREQAHRDSRASMLYTSGLLQRNEGRGMIGADPVPGGDTFKPDAGAQVLFGAGGVPNTSKPNTEKAVSRKGHPAYTDSHECCDHRTVEKATTHAWDEIRDIVREYMARVQQADPATNPLAAAQALGWLEAAIRTEYAERLPSLARQAVDDLGAGVEYQLVNEPALEFARQYSVELAREIAAETQRVLSETITTGIEQGLTSDEVSRLVAETLGQEADYRSERIARTETRYAQNMGSMIGHRAAGYTHKTWILAGGACPVCEAAKAMYPSAIPIDQPFFRVGDTVPHAKGVFTVAWQDVMFPPLHPNDRCQVVFSMEAEQ